MALNWSLTDIAAWETLCWVAPTETDGVQPEKTLNPVTNALIWATMVVDIGHLTATNAEEFYDRLEFYQRLFGPLARGVTISLNDVKAHVGLRTNVVYVRNTTWSARMLTNWYREQEQGRKRT